MSRATSWSGAILCGGRSLRMGRDKALLEVDGVPMAVRAVEALAEAGAARIATIGGDRPALAAVVPDTVEVIGDEVPGEGPLGGILTALRHLDTDIVLVVACDLVAPSPAAMAATVAALAGDRTADLAAPWQDEQVQWLHAAWRRAAVSRLAARLEAGERAVHRAVADAALTITPVRGLDPAALADADTPADLAAERRLDD